MQICSINVFFQVVRGTILNTKPLLLLFSIGKRNHLQLSRCLQSYSYKQRNKKGNFNVNDRYHIHTKNPSYLDLYCGLESNTIDYSLEFGMKYSILHVLKFFIPFKEKSSEHFKSISKFMLLTIFILI